MRPPLRFALLPLTFALLPTSLAAAPPDLRPAIDALAPAVALAPSGVLIDRAVPISRMERFDGSAAAPPATAAALRQMSDELWRASSGAIGEDGAALRERARADAARGVIPVALLDAAYDRLRPDAADAGLLEIRGGRVASVRPEALESRRVFAAAALREYTVEGGSVVFRVDATTDESIARLQMDFDDGWGFREVQPGAGVSVRYAATGPRTVRVLAEAAGGEIRHASFPFDVRRLFVPTPQETLAVTATVPWLGAFGTGDAYIYRSAANPVLTNPVIVVEGFDLDNSLNWPELYDLLNQQNLLEDLRADGFDAVVLNFTEATAPIQENAFVVTELIEEINSMIAPPATTVLAGASMGGLCSRYALTWMEDQAIDARVRTWISFDAPHGGANIPLGIQYWVDFFSGLSTDAAYLASRLDTPAARQMLVYHYTTPPSGAPAADPMRAAYQADLASIGDWPQLPRKVAIANGSGQAQDQGYAPGAQLIDYQYTATGTNIRGNIWAVPDAAPTTKIFDGNIVVLFFPLGSEIVNVSGTLPWDNAPGGKRDSMFQMDTTTAPYGDIVAVHDDHCFVGTVSSLALNVTDPFFDVSADPDPLALTEFDAIYWPAVNEDHVEITAQSAAWFRAEVGAGAVGAPAIAAGPASELLTLQPAAPNPFRAAAGIRFTLGAESPVTVDVHDVRGRLVRRLVDGDVLPAGPHAVSWESGDLPSGVYLYRVTTPGASAEGKAVLLR